MQDSVVLKIHRMTRVHPSLSGAPENRDVLLLGASLASFCAISTTQSPTCAVKGCTWFERLCSAADESPPPPPRGESVVALGRDLEKVGC
jgi:hypothetical protein